MASINDYLVQLQTLTQQNLEILQAINDSFFTKHDHLLVDISGQKIAMPSFISLENKINKLTANFNNLIHAPESGEAYFNMDGNSRAIEVRSYTQTPNSLSLPNTVTSFNIEQNHVFKDFLTPTPYLKFDIGDIPNDITKVIVKKIIPLNTKLLTIFEEELTNTITDADGNKTYNLITSKNYAYRNLAPIIAGINPDTKTQFVEGVDYIEYDTVVDLPIRKNIGSGVYVIEKIVEDIVDDNLDNFITLKFRTDMLDDSVYMNKLEYRLFDEVVTKPLRIGDVLTTFEGNAKVQIYEVNEAKNTVKVKVLYGEYLNLSPSKSNDPNNISSLSKLKFFSSIDFSKDKYVKIPLEEDNLIFVTVAALNSRMNIQSPWGTGLMLRAHNLILDGKNQTFKEYYTNNVRNIGDILNEISMLNDNSLTKQNPSDFARLTSPDYKPSIDRDKLTVIQVNSHLDNSDSIKKIRNLHALKRGQKRIMDDQLAIMQRLDDEMAGLPTDDPDNKIVNLQGQRATAQETYDLAFQSYLTYVESIKDAVDGVDIPIDNAKFRIRGYFDYSSYLGSLGLSKYTNNVLSIQVQYRYSSSNGGSSTAIRIDDNFTFSDWVEMPSIKRSKLTRFNSNSKTYTYQKQEANDNVNEISWNQIEIPISQGEAVDMRLRVMYDFGYPYAETYSCWSDTLNVEFPDELYNMTPILDIIGENNVDIQKNYFEGILSNNGVTQHINDKIITESQEIYFHDPKHIPSGFVTEGRKIISLLDKLKDMQATIDILSNEVLGSEDSIRVTVETNSGSIELLPFHNRNIPIEPYLTVAKDSQPDYIITPIGPDNLTPNDFIYSPTVFKYYDYNPNNGKVSTILNINITNIGTKPINLFTLFPGNVGVSLNNLKMTKFDIEDYCLLPGEKTGVYIYDYTSDKSYIQTTNQFLTFRVRDVSEQVPYYSIDDPLTKLSATDKFRYDQVFSAQKSEYPKKTQLFMYPHVSGDDALLVQNQISYDRCLRIPAKKSIVIPIKVEYYWDGVTNYRKNISFDLRPSLYKDPVTYTFNVRVGDSADVYQAMKDQRFYEEKDELEMNIV